MPAFNFNETNKRFSDLEVNMGELIENANQHIKTGNIEQAITTLYKAVYAYNDTMVHINQVYQSGHNKSLDERQQNLRASYDVAKDQLQDLKFTHYESRKAEEISEKTDYIKNIIQTNINDFKNNISNIEEEGALRKNDYYLLTGTAIQIQFIADDFINSTHNHREEYPAFVKKVSDIIEGAKPEFGASISEKIADVFLKLLNGLYSVINTIAKACGAENNVVNPHSLFGDYYTNRDIKVNECTQQFKDGLEVDSDALEVKTTYQI